MNQNQINKIKSLKGKMSDTEIRKEIRKIGYKKTAANNWFNKIFAAKDDVSFDSDGDIHTGEDNKIFETTDPTIRTLNDLIRVCQIDTSIWECVRFTGNSYGENFQAKGEFKKKVSSDISTIIQDLKNDMLKYSPDIPEYFHAQDPKKEKVMLEVCAFDLHLGKLGWDKSDGQDYDLEIAKTRFKEATSEILSSASIYNVEKILFPIGNDYLTIDNDKNTTTALTPQSVDSRFPKIFKEGRELLVWAINLLSRVAPVQVIVVAGNHEANSMHHIGDSLECWYRNDENVVVDNTPAPRKYFSYGKVLIGYDHGDKVKINKLPMLMASECKQWSAAEHREIHIGHLHHEKAIITECDSCIVRIVPALSGNDYYHNSHGYIGAKQRAQGFVWNAETGLKSIIYSKSYN